MSPTPHPPQDVGPEGAEQRFERAFLSAPIGMAIVAVDGRFVSVNPSLCETLGHSEAELLATDLQSLAHPEDLEADVERLGRLLGGEALGDTIEMRRVGPGGADVVWMQLSVALVRDAAAAPLYFVAQIQDITERKSREEELRDYADQLGALAMLEPLTGLRSQRGFHTAVDEELARCRRHGGCFSIVMFDIDQFARMNEDRGRQAGDAALRHVAAAIRRVCRASDTTARLGGDEFGLLLPETDQAGARVTAERAQADLAGLDLAISVSLGIASWPADGDTKELLLLRADMALYGTKPVTEQLVSQRLEHEEPARPDVPAPWSSGTPRWHAQTAGGAGPVLGDVRCVCEDCGAHVRAIASSATLGGSCINCGGYRLSVVGD
jgi:diguanylate cyclase (GGDEF)-like protein/PAS domain S-box-containing protein